MSEFSLRKRIIEKFGWNSGSFDSKGLNKKNQL